ncbi:DeoR/GlpR family DNA-binding transcription regulator [Paenibacillus pasadenensis]|uniref:DeoR/GlpR family DNA-binding transcription regulator n=1 Tax=Paenibacillus pasadenensis TaxID=217090 RepID=UPI0020406AD6|nr:DeoR/GlpR family DNA-binding transcription regulator [Paenibacillus pasadenensis]MCM3747067.1 DeoR/GlpR family DNA-binding transcription regulator [Paenibacillus pasadenensis]
MASFLAAERRNKILDYLFQQKRATVKELSELLGVSEVTLRSDLRLMDKDGLIQRTHGGVILQEEPRNEHNFSVREKKNHDEKSAIGQSALEFVEDGQCIVLDGSSTVLEMARGLKKMKVRLTVITNGMYTALELSENPGLTVILIGGVLRVGSSALEGTLGKTILEKINVDTMFTSASGFTAEEGLTDFNVYEVELKKEMAAASTRIVALLDHSKIGRNSISTFAAANEIHTIITDSATPRKIVDEIRGQGINVIVP